MRTYARTLHGIELFDEEPLEHGLFFALDSNGGPRVHDGEFYKGYVNAWTRERYQVQASGRNGAKFVRRTYRTLAGAVRALKWRAVTLNAPQKG